VVNLIIKDLKKGLNRKVEKFALGAALFRVIITGQNHGTVWVGRDLKDHLVPTPLP